MAGRPMAYVAIRPGCRGYTAVRLDEPGDRGTVRTLARWRKQGWSVERVTAPAALAGLREADEAARRPTT